MWSSFISELNNLPAIAVRLVAASIAGGIIGWERETFKDLPISHRGSIFRLYALVCFGACMFTVAGLFGSSDYSNISDRIPAQVVSGVGFLGAGIILTDRQGIIRGLPTAAGIWVSASIGLTIGYGHFLSGFLGAFLVFIIMDLPHRFPKFFRVRNLISDTNEIKDK